MNEKNDFDSIPRRPLGKTGEQVSALGLGGYHIRLIKDDAEAIRLIHEAIDAGVTFLDNAWEYHDGGSEELMGKAIHARRDQVFLMTKVCTHGRNRHVAMQQLEESLRRLQTDYLDLWQVHECVYYDEPDLHFAQNGVIEALDQAKQEGKVRFVGFTGHKDPTILLRMLEHNYPFDTCQLPLNCFDAGFRFRSFEQEVLSVLIKHQIAPLGMKSFGGKAEMIQAGAVTAEEALRYAMSLPVAVTISGIDSREVLLQNLGVARGFAPMSEGEKILLRERCAKFAADGRFELYKTTAMHEGNVGRQQHGFPAQEQLAA